MHPEPVQPAALSPAVLEQAAEWMMRLHEDASVAAHQQWRRWHDAHPDHIRAWQRAEQLMTLTAQVPAPLAQRALQVPASRGRRAVLRSVAGVLLGVPLGGLLAWRLWDQAAWDASVRTAVGERRRVVLDDGSVLHLATASAVDVAFDGQQRLVRLRRGEIHIETAVDPQRPARPFRVATSQGMLRALGTRFSVRLFDRDALLIVQEGAVQLTADTASQRVEAGQQVRWHATGLPEPLPAPAGSDAWTQGMLVADSLPLQALLAELGRYHHRWLRVDPAIAALPVSGAFPLDDLDRSLSMLADTCPVQVEHGLLAIRLRAAEKPE